MKINSREIEICQEARQWLDTQTDAESAWNNCERSDWMLYILDRCDLLTPHQDLQLQLAFLDTPLGNGRVVLDLINDKRSLAFVALKRRKLAGENISETEWESARAAARVAAYAAYVAYAAYAAAADAAADAARRWQADKIRELIPFPQELKDEQI